MTFLLGNPSETLYWIILHGGLVMFYCVANTDMCQFDIENSALNVNSNKKKVVYSIFLDAIMNKHFTRECQSVVKKDKIMVGFIRKVDRLATLMTEREKETLDATGLICPEPLMVTRNRLRDMQSGDILKIIATDPSTSWDFPNFCRFIGHELVDVRVEGDQYTYWIRKA